MVSNAKGEVTFKNLEVGNYTLLVVAPPAAPSAAQNAAEDKFSKTAKKVALCPHGVGAASCPKCKAIEDAKAGKTVTPPAAPAKLPPAPGKQDAKKADEAKMPQPDAQKESLGVPHVTLLK